MTQDQQAAPPGTPERVDSADQVADVTDADVSRQDGKEIGEDAGADEQVLTDADIIAQLREDLAATQAKANEYLDKWQRAAADFQNSRRRLEAQVSEEVERANAGLIMRLLPVLDDLDLAFSNVPEGVVNADGTSEAAWLQGFRQIRKKLLDLLDEHGVSRVATDGEFDPHLHEAISSEPHETVPSGHVIDEIRAGYAYRGRVLRPALVRVAS